MLLEQCRNLPANLCRGNAGNVFRWDDRQHVQLDIGMMPGRTMVNLFCSGDGENNNGGMGHFGNFKNTVMERQQCSGFAAGSLRVDSNRDSTGLQKFGRLADGFKCFPRVVAIDGEKTAFADNTTEQRNAKVFFFGDKGDVLFPESIPGQNRVKIGAVIPNEQQRTIRWYLFQTGDVNTNSQQANANAGRTVKQPTVKRMIAGNTLAWIYQNTAYGKQYKITHHNGEKCTEQVSYQKQGKSPYFDFLGKGYLVSCNRTSIQCQELLKKRDICQFWWMPRWIIYS